MRRKSVQRQIAEGDPGRKGPRKLQERLQSAPKAEKGLPPCPKHLKGRARETWAFLREELEKMDLDSRPDALALEGMVSSYVLAADADEILAREGLQREVPIYHRGQQISTAVQNHPALRIRAAAWTRFTAFADRFGLSPQARQALAIDRPDDAEAELQALLSKPRPKRVPPTPEKENIQ